MAEDAQAAVERLTRWAETDEASVGGSYHTAGAADDVQIVLAALAQAWGENERLRNLPNLRLKFSLEKRGWKWHAPFWSKPGYCADAEGAACFQMAQSEQEQRARDAEVLEKWAETLENTMVRRALLDGASIIRAQSEG